MLETNQNNQENTPTSQEASTSFDPNDATRIAELESKFEKKEMTQEILAQARDINEFSSYLGQLSSFNDSMAGSVSVARVLDTIGAINLDLGQAVGLMRQNGSAEGTPQAIIQKAYADIANLPFDLQKLYRPLAVKYLTEARADVAKN